MDTGIETTLGATNQTEGLNAMQSIRFKISGATVNQATADLPDEQRRALRWLHSYALDGNISLDDLAAQLRKPDGQPYSRDSLYQALTGRRQGQGASLANLCQSVERFRKVEEERMGATRAAFVKTPLSRRLWKVCDMALQFQRIAFVYGESQIGKTTALREYAGEHNHETVYIRMPTKGVLSEFLIRLATQLRISPRLPNWQLKDSIFKAFDSRMLLIVDQCHECFRSVYSDRSIATLLFIMELFDARNCGIVLVGTNVFEKGLVQGVHQEAMKQLIRRGLPRALRLPDKPDKASLDAFAAHYQLPPADGDALELQTEVIRDHDLGIWLTTLQAGSRLAAKKNKPMTWEHVIMADSAFRTLGGEH